MISSSKATAILNTAKGNLEDAASKITGAKDNVNTAAGAVGALVMEDYKNLENLLGRINLLMKSIDNLITEIDAVMEAVDEAAND